METVFEKPLNGEIGNLTNLTTTAKTDLVSAVNEVKGDIPAVINNLTSDSTTSALSAAMGKSLNSKITDITTMSTSAGTFSTLVGLATILNTAVSSMNTYEIKRIRVDCSATVYPFTNGYSYDVELCKFNGDTYIHANFYAGGQIPIYVGVKDGSGWSFDELALKSSLYTAYSNNWVDSLSVNLPKQGAYLFVSQRYAQMTILIRFQNGNTSYSNISGSNWTFTSGTNGNITATASNQADYYIIPLVPTM